MASNPKLNVVFKQNFKAVVGNPSVQSLSGGSMGEWPPSYAPQYPFNNLLVSSERGHLIEIDDTMDAERIHIYHHKGSHIEFRPDGTVKYKSVNGRQDVTIGDNEVIIQGKWKVTTGGDIQLLARDGNITIQSKNAITLNSSGEVKIKGQNISFEAANKIALSAPFIDVGSYMSFPASVVPLFGVPVPVATGLASKSMFKTATSGLVGLGGLSLALAAGKGILSFVKAVKDNTAAAKVLKNAPKNPYTKNPAVPTVAQPTEVPLASPGLYNKNSVADAQQRARQFDTPEDTENSESYSAHRMLSATIGDYVRPSVRGRSSDAMLTNLPGYIVEHDETSPSGTIVPPTSFRLNGTVSCERDSGIVTGTGTSFDTDLVANQTLRLNDGSYTVVSVINSTAVQITPKWNAPTSADIVPYVAQVRPFRSFSGTYTWPMTASLEPDNPGGLVLSDVMRNFHRPIVEKLAPPTNIPVNPMSDIASDNGGSGSSGGSDWAPPPPYTAGEYYWEIPAGVSLDDAVIREQIHTDLLRELGVDCYTESGIQQLSVCERFDIDYWIRESKKPGSFSDGEWWVGWNGYFLSRIVNPVRRGAEECGIGDRSRLDRSLNVIKESKTWPTNE